MAEPIEYLVVRNLQSTLAAITVAGGYHFDLMDVAVKLDPDVDVDSIVAPDGPRPFVILDILPVRRTYEPAMQVRVVLPVHVHWVTDVLEPTRDESRLEAFFRGCADVEQAIAIDPSRGGRAIDTRITAQAPRSEEEAAGRVWAVIEIEIALRRTYGAPNA